MRRGDFVLGDAGYSTARGIAVAAAGVTSRCAQYGLAAFSNPDGTPRPGGGGVPGPPGRAAVVAVATDAPSVAGRVCAVRKSDTAVGRAHARLRRKASKSGKRLQPETLEYAKCVILFTTFPASGFEAAAVLDWYRIRWQVELVFKRFKSLAKLGHLPKHDDESAKAWLYGKLFTALLVEKLIRHADAVSPWGCDLRATPHP